MIKKEIRKARMSRNFVVALSVVSILGFLSIVVESFFYWSFSNYLETLWLITLGTGLMLESNIKELRKIKKKGLPPENLGKLTMLIVGSISIIAGLLSLPQIRLQHPVFLAIKGIVGILAIIFIVIQTWVAE